MSATRDRDARLSPLPSGPGRAAPFDPVSLGLIGKSDLLAKLRARIRLLAPHPMPVMILGPTGSGKELVARALHECSRRAGNPLHTINCSQSEGALAESRFFGHSQGAFTGATKDERGLFVQAHGSTLFMDELGELAKPAQALLLRTVEYGEVTRARAPARVRAREHATMPRALRLPPRSPLTWVGESVEQAASNP